MDVISSWTGARADALRRAMRMSNEAFAERLGAAVRTVAYWRERPSSIPQPVMQEALDTALAQAPERVQAQFWIILAEHERERVSLQPGLASAPLTPASAELTCDPARPEVPWLSSEVPPSDPSARGARLVTPGDLATVRGVRAHLKAIDNAHGGGTALPMATMYLRSEIFPLLDGCAHDAHSQSLIEAVAEYELDAAFSSAERVFA